MNTINSGGWVSLNRNCPKCSTYIPKYVRKCLKCKSYVKLIDGKMRIVS